MLQRDFLTARRFILVHGLLELGQVVQPLLAAFGAKRFLIAAGVENCRQDLRYRPALVLGGKGLDELCELAGLRPLKQAVVHRFDQGFVQGAAAGVGVFLQKGHAPLAQIALRHVGDPPEGQVVFIGDDAQIAEGVLDFLAAKKLDAAVYDVGYVFLQQRFLHSPRHVMGPVQDGHVLVRHAAFAQGLHAPGQPLPFSLRAFGKMADDGVAVGQGRPERLGHAAHVVVDEGVGCRQNLGRRAVIIHHQNGLRSREGLVEFEEILHVGAAPRINRLVRVADDE